MPVLSDDQVDAYQRDGFVRLVEAFPRALAEHCCDLLWEQLPEQRDDPSTWKRPVARLSSQDTAPFREACASPRWLDAIQQVAPGALAHPFIGGTVAVRFPVAGDPGDDGWHIDASFERDGTYWVNAASRGRSLLMLVLFSDVTDDDAPTRIRVGSHAEIATTMLEPYGDEGVPFSDIALPDHVHERPIALATGLAGDVYLCHPFLVHAAQRHRGSVPRFVGQPGALWLSEVASPG